jgi:hypothetical protein
MMMIIFVIILIILIVIFVLLTINNNKIERFVNYSDNEIQFNLNINNSDINKFELVSYNNNLVIDTKKIVLYGLPVYIYETVDMPGSDSIYAVFSSFVFNVNSGYSSNRSLLATTKLNNPLSVSLIDNGFLNKNKFNYIFFNFPEEIRKNIFTKIEIFLGDYYEESNFNIFTFDNSSVGNKISKTTLLKIPIRSENKGSTNKITFAVYSEYTMEKANLVLVILNLTAVNIASIKFYFKTPKIGGDQSSSDKNVAINPGTMNTMTTNPHEQVNIMGLDIFNTFTEEEETVELYSLSGITQNINLLTKLRVPWGIYDANSVYQNNTAVLIEQLKGGCKNAIIHNPASIEKDGIYYIKGNINTCIEFPDGSMPEVYTICAITKYTNSGQNNKMEVLKTLNYPIINIGHSSFNRGVVTKDNTHYTTEASSDFKSKNSTDFVITCIKSSGKNANKTIIINNEKRGKFFLGNLTQSNKLIINSLGVSKANCSEFGFAYMIIWDQLLSDNELVMVSNILNMYVTDTTRTINIDRTFTTVLDGSTIEKAANSAYDIMVNFCIKKNGRFWIKSGENQRPEYVFCIMDRRCKGGGWMLAMKGSRYNNKTFHYNSIHWTNPTFLLPSTQPDYDFEPNGEYLETELDAKYNIFNTFKAKECLAMFDPRDCGIENNPAYYYDINSLKKYGWLWHEKNFNNGGSGGNGTTLLNFFRSGTTQFDYSTPIEGNVTSLINYMNSVYNNPTMVRFLRYNDTINQSPRFKLTKLFDYTNSEYQSMIYNVDTKGPCNIKIWSTQDHFYSFGFNVGPVIAEEASRVHWPHRVRWGCSYNENGDSKPTTNDVSGGIGMECREYSAGDGIGCCHATVGQNKHFSFKWFIR